jgi:hypothetical protein
MKLRTAALAAALAFTAPAAAHADFWTDFFGSADEMKRVHFGVQVIGEKVIPKVSTATGEALGGYRSFGKFDEHFECDMKVIESCEFEASGAQIFKFARKPNPENEDELLYDFYYRPHNTLRKPQLVSTYKWEDFEKGLRPTLGVPESERVRDLFIRFYEVGK